MKSKLVWRHATNQCRLNADKQFAGEAENSMAWLEKFAYEIHMKKYTKKLINIYFKKLYHQCHKILSHAYSMNEKKKKKRNVTEFRTSEFRIMEHSLKF